MQPDIWRHLYDGVDYDQFRKDLSNSAIVCVSHFMPYQFRFFSNVCVQAIPHYVPEHLFDAAVWRPDERFYINIVNNFYADNRGVGAKFWDSIDFVDKKLYGAGNRPADAGALESIEQFQDAVAEAAAFLWTADAVAISFAPLEAMLLGCPVIAPKNLDWPLFYEDRVNILLYEEGNYNSCRAAVEYFQSSPAMRRELSARGRATVLEMNRAELFRERWSRVLAAAETAARRGQRRLKMEAAAPPSPFTSLRPATTENPGFVLVTNMDIGGQDALIAHRARTWTVPRQVFRKYRNLESYSPIKYELVRSASGIGKTLFYIGADFELYSVLAARCGSSVACFDFHEFAGTLMERTKALNGLEAISFEKIAFDDGAHRMWAADHSKSRSRSKWADLPGYEITTTKFDDHVAEKGVTDIDLIVIDDVGFETRILRGAEGILAKRKPELVVNCFRHGAYAIGAPVNELLQMLDGLGYRMRYASSLETAADLREIESLQVPELDHFILHAVAKREEIESSTPSASSSAADVS
ncbi:glycosyltransferase [Methylosinus sp. Ce-a6]|uniref:glycosyltransferase family protein n=1 Tax=Methylosinus sp. Ce-a6 TaxID=2172005 RepID=UPI001357A173|nr:glycosyltransferase [Methylosinus sp. Ce-a6]